MAWEAEEDGPRAWAYEEIRQSSWLLASAHLSAALGVIVIYGENQWMEGLSHLVYHAAF